MSKHKLAASYKSKDSGVNDRRRNRANMTASAAAQFIGQAQIVKAERAEKFPFSRKFACPTGVNMTFTADPLYGPYNHVLALNGRNPATRVFIYDRETFSLLASGLHHHVMAELGDSRVMVMRTEAEFALKLKELLAELYLSQKAQGLNRGRIRIFAHNGAGFDWSGFAKFVGVDINTTLEEQHVFGTQQPLTASDSMEVMEKGKLTKHNLTWSVEIYGDKPRMFLSCGSQNAFVIEFLDSAWLMAVPLSSLGGALVKKQKTPLKYTDPVKWLVSEGHNVTLADLNPYLEQAHRYEIRPDGQWESMFEVVDGVDVRSPKIQVYPKHPKNIRLSESAYKALVHWKSSLTDEDIEYSKTDVVVLANALTRYFELATSLGVPDPSSFNTAAMIGLAAMVKSAYSSALKRDEYGNLTPKFKLKYDRFARYSKGKVSLLDSEDTEIVKAGGKPFKSLLEEDEVDSFDDDYVVEEEDQSAPRVFQNHGYVEPGTKTETYITYPWYCTKEANQYFRIVQRGGRCEVIVPTNEDNTEVLVVDAVSNYPTAMAQGVDLWLSDLGEWSNALKGYVDPRMLNRGASKFMLSLLPITVEVETRAVFEIDQSALDKAMEDKKQEERDLGKQDIQYEDIAQKKESLIKRRIEKVKVPKIFGRVNVLRMLQIRSGMFYVRLPRSKCNFFLKFPVIPQQLGGSDLDSRLIFADWEGMLETYVTAEELVLFLSEQTENDDAVEVDLDRSLHGPILGIKTYYHRETGEARYSGRGWSPFAEFVFPVFRRRSEAKEKAAFLQQEIDAVQKRIDAFALAIEGASADADADLKEIEELRREYDAAMAEREMLKLIMNAGGYGPLAQMHAPEFDYAVEMISQAIPIVRRIAVQDAEWNGIAKHFAALDKALVSIEELGEEASELKSPAWENILQRLLKVDSYVKKLVAERNTLEYRLTSRGRPGASPKDVADKLALGDDRSLALQILGVDHFEEGRVDGKDVAWIAAIDYMHDLDLRIGQFTRLVTDMFVDYAESHLCSYESYSSIHPDTGRHITRFRIALPDTTAGHAIRPWAVAVTAKARVALMLGMREVHETGVLKVMYCDTDSIHFSVPIEHGITCEEKARQLLSKGRYIKLGNQLGNWNFESKFVREDLATAKHKKGAKVVCRHAFYASKKVYVFADEDYNILDCRARGVPRSNARMQAAMYGYAMRISRLGDRRGISANNLREIDLAAQKPVYIKNNLGDVITSEVPGLYAGFNRIYHSKHDSMPAVFSPANLPFKEGQMVTAAEVSQAYAAQVSQIQLGLNATRFDGMDEAKAIYEEKYRIAGRTVDSVRRELKREVAQLKDMLRGEDVLDSLTESTLLVEGKLDPTHENYFEGEILPF